MAIARHDLLLFRVQLAGDEAPGTSNLPVIVEYREQDEQQMQELQNVAMQTISNLKSMIEKKNDTIQQLQQRVEDMRLEHEAQRAADAAARVRTPACSCLLLPLHRMALRVYRNAWRARRTWMASSRWRV